MRYAWLTAIALVAAGSLSAADFVTAPGSRTTGYDSEIEATVSGKSVKMTLTGTGMRRKIIVNVYAVGSYVAADAKATAENLAGLDAVKRLHLIMERTVDGKDMAEAFRSAIRANYAEGTYNDEVNMLVRFMNSTSVRKGDHITLTHVPGVGLHINAVGKADFLIRNAAFSRAVWDIYLGGKNVGEDVKKGLVSRF